MFNKTNSNWNEVENIISDNVHLNTAQNIANESITLVKNNNNLLPINPEKYANIVHIMMSTDEGMKSRFKNYSRDIRKTHGNVEEIYINDKLTRLGIKDIVNKVKKTDLVIMSMLVRIRMDKGISTIDDSHNQLISKIIRLIFKSI